MSRDLRILEPENALPAPVVPVVVVQYRRGWIARLMMPVMILITATALLSHRMKADDWRGLSHYLGLKDNVKAAASPSVSEPRPAPEAAPPIIVTIVPEEEIPLPAPSLLDPPKPKPAIVAEATPVATPAAEVPNPTPAVRAGEVWDDIREEGERKQADAQALERMKDLQFEQDQRLTQQKKVEELQRDRVKAASGRADFRNALRAALTQPEGRAGPAIRDLCAREGVALGSSFTPPAQELVTTSAARKDRVEKLRGMQFSEAMILCDLIRLEAPNRVARRAGTRTPEDVVVRAARQLLLVPLSQPAPSPARTSGVARSARPR